MRCRRMYWGLLVIVASCGRVAGGAADPFEPLWLPERGSLVGWTIVIDPLPSMDLGAAEASGDELSLATGVYLRHFARRAGAEVLLVRTDMTPTTSDEAARLRVAPRVSPASPRVLAVTLRIQTNDKPIPTAGAQNRGDGHARLLADRVEAGLHTADVAKWVRPVVRARRWRAGLADVPEAEVRLVVDAAAVPRAIDARRSCYEIARRIHEGVHEYCDKLDADGSSGRADESNRIGRKGRRRLARYIAQITREDKLPLDDADWFCRRYADVGISNPTLVYFDVGAQKQGDGVVLTGSTNVPDTLVGLMACLRQVGIEQCKSTVRQLPDGDALGGRFFGVCCVPATLTHREPGRQGGLQSELVFGEPVWLLDRREGEYLLHAEDGYWGWVPVEAIEPMAARVFGAYCNLPEAVLNRDIDTGDVRIPRGTVVRLATQGDEICHLRLPVGGTVSIASTDLRPIAANDDAVRARIAAARELLYVPYVFGGCSPLGLDCSGLATHVFVRTGVRLARDARQQVLAGRLVATSAHRQWIKPGDQLFFLDATGKVYHTALALSDTQFIHAAPPCVQINSFDPADALYDKRLDDDFFVAKRSAK